MRCVLLSCLTLLLAPATFDGAISAPGAVENAVTMLGVARAASLMQAIGGICGPAGADIALSAKYSRAFAAAGREAYGPDFEGVLEEEMARRVAETHAVGAESWCAQQKRQLDRLGNEPLFPR